MLSLSYQASCQASFTPSPLMHYRSTRGAHSVEALSTLSQRMQRRLLAGSGAVELLAAAMAAELPAAAPLASQVRAWSCARFAPAAQDAADAETPAASVRARQGGDAAPALPPDDKPALKLLTTHARPRGDTSPCASAGTAACQGDNAPSACAFNDSPPAPTPLAAATLPLATPGTAAHQREDAPSACASSAPVASSSSSSPLAAALLDALAAASACRRCAGIMLACGALPLAVAALAASRLRDPAAPAALELVCALLAPNLSPRSLSAQGTAHGATHGTARSACAAIAATPEGAGPAHTGPAPGDLPVSGEADCAESGSTKAVVSPCGACGTASQNPAPCPETTRGLAGALARLIRHALLHGGRAADAALRNRALQLACQLAMGSDGSAFCRGMPCASISGRPCGPENCCGGGKLRAEHITVHTGRAPAQKQNPTRTAWLICKPWQQRQVLKCMLTVEDHP